MRVYPDACILIYWIENHPLFFQDIDTAITVPGIRLAFTELTRLECRVKPLREGNGEVLTRYDKIFSNHPMGLIALDQCVCELATELRARHGLKTPDALHLAAALNAGCDAFWTNDDRLEKAAAGRIAITTFD